MKRIRKFTPVSMYDAQGLESWLEDMAKQGLFLKNSAPSGASLNGGPPRRCGIGWSRCGSRTAAISWAGRP